MGILTVCHYQFNFGLEKIALGKKNTLSVNQKTFQPVERDWYPNWAKTVKGFLGDRCGKRHGIERSEFNGPFPETFVFKHCIFKTFKSATPIEQKSKML